MDFVAVTGVNYFLRRRKKWRRLFLTALLSSIIGLFLILWIKNALLYRLVAHFLLNTVMVGIAFGISGKREFLENFAVTYLVVIVLGGIMQGIQESNLIPSGFLLQILVTGLLCYMILTYLMQRKTFQNHIFPAEIKKDVRCMQVKAYWDSGNQLRDPCTGQAVSILSRKLASGFLDDSKDNIRYVPFRSLGEEQGLLEVTNIDELLIYDGKKVIRMEQMAIGIAGEGLLEDKEYDLILHATYL